MFSQGDGSREAAIWTADSDVTLHTYAITPARGIGLSDGLNVEFSPDDGKVLLFDTFINTSFDNPIMVFETDGTLVIELESGVFPVFNDNDSFYYLGGGELRMWDISDASFTAVSTLSDLPAFNLALSFDQDYISFWSNIDDEHTRLYTYDLEDAVDLITNDLAIAKWMDNAQEYLIALKTDGYDIMEGFTQEGLARVDRSDGSLVTLETESVFLFEVED
jgi:hypothetical protein